MQFVRPLSLSFVKFLLEAVGNGLVGRLGLTTGIRVGDHGEPGLAPQGAKIVDELIGVEWPAVIKDDGMGNVEASDDIPLDEPPHIGCGCGGNDLGLYPLSEVVDRYKEILTLAVALEKGSGISMPRVANGRALTIGVMGVEGTR